MCEECWQEHGKPDNWNPAIARTANNIRTLYQDPDCMMGGPLHVVVEDWNIEDQYLKPYDGLPWNTETWNLAVTIIADLKTMTLQERAATLAHAHGYTSCFRPKQRP